MLVVVMPNTGIVAIKISITALERASPTVHGDIQMMIPNVEYHVSSALLGKTTSLKQTSIR